MNKFKKTYAILIILIIPILMVACSIQPENDLNVKSDYPDNNDVPEDHGYSGVSGSGYGEYSDTYELSNNHVYYVRSSGGSDSNTGTGYGSAFETLSKVQEVAVSGDTIYLEGTFDRYEETNSGNRNDWITYLSYNSGDPAVINGLYVNNTTSYNTYLRFDNIDFAFNNDANITSDHIPYSSIMRFDKANYIEIRNCEIHEYLDIKYHVDKAVSFSGDYVLIYHNHIHSSQSGVWGTGDNYTVVNNHLHDSAGGPFISLFGTNWIAEGNNIHDSNWDATHTCHIHTGVLYQYGVNGDNEDYDGLTVGCAYAQGFTEVGQNPHNSGIAVWNGSGIIKRNIIHDCGNTSGIRFYPNYVDRYDNIVVENNLVYDTHNAIYPLSLENCGNNIMIRNNTFIGSLRTGSIIYARNKLYGSLNISLGSNSDGSGIFLYNNIIVGVMTGYHSTMTCRDNIFWSVKESGEDYLSELVNNSIICSSTAPASEFENIMEYFTDNYFNGIIDVNDFVHYHQLIMDFTLNSSSAAVDTGDADYQPSESLGSIDGDGFILNNGVIRDFSSHSAGCYEQ